MTFKKGDPMGTAAIVQKCMRGTADAHSMELLNVEDVAMGPTVTTKHKFSRLEWLPITIIPVIILYCSVGGCNKAYVERGRSTGRRSESYLE